MIDIATIRLGEDRVSVFVNDRVPELAVGIQFRKPDDTGAVVVMSKDQAAEVRDSLSRAIIIAGRTSTQIHGDLLIGSLRHTLGLLVELDKTSPGEVERVLTALVAHIRSWRPQALAATEVKP